MPNLSNLIMKPNRFPDIPRVAGVYLITDIESGKCYVGSTQNVNLRISNYFCKSQNKNNTLSHLNYNNCTFKVLENCKYLTKDQRLQLEYEWIIKLDTKFPKGYNKRHPITNKLFDGVVNIKKGTGKKKIKKKTVSDRFFLPYSKYSKTGINVLRDY